MRSSFLERLLPHKLYLSYTTGRLTRHGGVDAPNVGEETNFGKLDSKQRRLNHLVLEDLTALATLVQRVHIQIAEVNLGRRFIRSCTDRTCEDRARI